MPRQAKGKHSRTCYDKYHEYDKMLGKTDFITLLLHVDGFKNNLVGVEQRKAYGTMVAFDKLGVNINKEILSVKNIQTNSMAHVDDIYEEMLNNDTIKRLRQEKNLFIAPESFPYDLAELFPADLEPWELVNQICNQKHSKYSNFSVAVLVYALSGISKEFIFETFDMNESEYKNLLYHAVETLKGFSPMRFWIANVDIEQVPVYTGINSFLESMEYRAQYYKRWTKMLVLGFNNSFLPDNLENDPLTSLPIRPKYSRKVFGTLIVSPPYIR